MFKQSLLLSLLSLCSYTTLHAASITTAFDGSLGQSGNMFDLVTAGNDITVTGFDVNLGYGTYDLALYTVNTSWQGNEATPTNWSLLSTTTVSSVNAGVPTFADFSDFSISANTSIGIYVTLMGPEGTMYYSEGASIGDVFASNADLQILQGIGVEYPFNSFYQPRGWNGTIYYESITAVPVPAAFWLFTAGLVGLFGVAKRPKV